MIELEEGNNINTVVENDLCIFKRKEVSTDFFDYDILDSQLEPELAGNPLHSFLETEIASKRRETVTVQSKYLYMELASLLGLDGCQIDERLPDEQQLEQEQTHLEMAELLPSAIRLHYYFSY